MSFRFTESREVGLHLHLVCIHITFCAASPVLELHGRLMASHLLIFIPSIFSMPNSAPSTFLWASSSQWGEEDLVLQETFDNDGKFGMLQLDKGANGLQWVELRNTAEHLSMHRTSTEHRELSGPICQKGQSWETALSYHQHCRQPPGNSAVYWEWRGVATTQVMTVCLASTCFRCTETTISSFCKMHSFPSFPSSAEIEGFFQRPFWGFLKDGSWNLKKVVSSLWSKEAPEKSSLVGLFYLRKNKPGINISLNDHVTFPK